MFVCISDHFFLLFLCWVIFSYAPAHASTSSRPPPLFIVPVYQRVRVPTQPGGKGAQRMSDKTCSVLPRHLSEPHLSSVCRDGNEQE